MENGRYVILAAALSSNTIKIYRWEKENKF
jgi:hypothetical protein